MIRAVGVMNIIYFVVDQRTRKIGIRRAVGALKKHIFQQLFTEALTITFLGGLIGFGLGWGLNAGLTDGYNYPGRRPLKGFDYYLCNQYSRED
jgi:putative ABC transport system permease protein